MLTHIDLGSRSEEYLVVGFAPARSSDQNAGSSDDGQAEGRARFERVLEKIRE